MKFKCEKHGIVDNLPDYNGHLICPICYQQAVIDFFGNHFDVNITIDEYGNPTLIRAWSKDIIVSKIFTGDK